ncbi:hypothetical protein ACQP2C_29220 [Micromonospora zamorensis]|uniref:hypothetical protein n=1 Tax=Micromonospora zamorensis TaxID=709883 RepID=UPI003D95FCAD
MPVAWAGMVCVDLTGVVTEQPRPLVFATVSAASPPDLGQVVSARLADSAR